MWTCGGLTSMHRHGQRWFSQLEVTSACCLSASHSHAALESHLGTPRPVLGSKGLQCAPKTAADVLCMTGLMVYGSLSMGPLAMPGQQH